MTTNNKKLSIFVLAGIVALSSVAAINLFNTQTIEAEQLEGTPTNRLNQPFSFNLPETTELTSAYSDISGGTPWANIAKDETKNFPILIKARGNESSTIKFHATYGNQMDDIVLPKGMTAKLVPDTISLEPDESKIINLVVSTDSTVEDSWVIMNIVGVYGDGVNDFKGTGIKLNVGAGDEKFANAYEDRS